MHLSELLRRKTALSFEVFPPKLDHPIEPLLDTLEKLYAFRPDFISCTYGACGSNKGRNLDIVASIQKRGVCEALSHYTCVGNSQQDISNALDEYVSIGVNNLLALRGDFPNGAANAAGAFSYASELIAFIRDRWPSVCIAAGCYPEKHLLADSLESDIGHLLEKQEAGASVLMSQLCYHPEALFRFRDLAHKRGVVLPIVVGVLPVIRKDGLIRMTLSNGCSIPAELSELIGRYGDDEAAFRSAGRDFTVRLIERYRSEGVDGIHIYTLNRYEDVAGIVAGAGLSNGIC